MYSTLKDYRFNKDIDDTGQLSHEGLWRFPKSDGVLPRGSLWPRPLLNGALD